MKIKDALKSFRKSLAKILFDKKIKSNRKLDIENIKSVLFLRDDDKIGDMVVSTLLFRELKKKYPKIKIIVLCGKNNSQVIKHNPYVDKIAHFVRSLYNSKVGLAVDFFSFRPRPFHLLALRLINAGFLIGFNKDGYNTYDLSINRDFSNDHISKRYEYFLNLLGIENASLKYDIFLDGSEIEKAMDFYKSRGAKYNILINPSSASIHRSLDFDKLKNLSGLIKENTGCAPVVLCRNVRDLEELKKLGDETIIPVITESVLEAAAFVKYSDIVISPDTSIVHIAAAFEKKTVSLYLDYENVKEKIDKIWAPNNPNAIQLCVNTKNGILENDIKNIDNSLIIESLQKLLTHRK